MWRRRFLTAGWALVILMVIGAIVSIVAEWPAQFGGEGDPDQVASEFMTRGTALAPPLGPVVLFAVAIFLARRADGVGTGGVVVAMFLSIVFTVGSLGEALAPETDDVPRAALVACGLIGASVSLLVLWLGAATLRSRSQG